MNPKRILIIQLRRVGDVVFTLPVIGALRRQFPSAQIDFLVEKPGDQMVRLHPEINNTLVYDSSRPLRWLREIRSKKYDWVLDFHSNGRTLMLSAASGASVRAGFKGPISRQIVYTHSVPTTTDKYLPEQKLDILRALGVPCGGWTWGLRIPKEESLWAEQFLRESGVIPGEILIGLAPATRRPIRAWREERFAEVAEKLISESSKILFLYGPGEIDLIRQVKNGIKNGSTEKVIIPPEISLLKLAALIQKCGAVVAVDNGPKNMAVALDVPTITLSGPTNPLSFDPFEDPRHLVLRDSKLHCISCGTNLCAYKHECMDNISVDQVLRGLNELTAPLKISKAAV